MSKAGTNEAIFSRIIESKFGKILKGKKIWRDENSGVEISVDQIIKTKDFDLLIEIDSGNYAKLIAGQYLINILKGYSKRKAVFIVIHFYNRKTDKPYNPERTNKNLKLINDKMFDKRGIPFLSFNLKTFNEFIDNTKSINDLNSLIIKTTANN